MRKIKLKPKTKITVQGIKGFIEKTVTPFGTGAKVDCPKEYLGHPVYLIIQEKNTERNKTNKN
jgi:putative transposon-encoded protein